MPKWMATFRNRVQRLLLWRVWERMLEIEFIDRSVALAGKAFVSFFPLVIVVAAFVPERTRSSIITSVTARLGIRGDALTLARDAFASSDDIRRATGATVLAVLRDGNPVVSPPGDFHLQAGDHLLALGTREQLERLDRRITAGV